MTDAQIIELDGYVQRSDAFLYRILNTDRSPLAEAVDVVASPAPTVGLDTSRATGMRTMSGVTILSPPTDLIVPRARIQPLLALQNGSLYSLGVLMFGQDTRNLYTGGNIWVPELFDENFLLDQSLPATASRPAGSSVLEFFDALAGAVLGPLGVPVSYTVADVACATPLAYKVGTSRNAALRALAALLGALPPFFDNNGVYTLKGPPNPTDAPDHIYTPGTRVFDGTVSTTDSSYKAPNRYIVVGGDVSGVAIRGVFDIPDSAPHSYAQTGRRVTAPPHTVSGVTDNDLATQIAYVDAITDRTTYTTASFAAAADPRHDAFDSVSLYGDLYLETAWSISCESGGPHSHSLTRVWQ